MDWFMDHPVLLALVCAAVAVGYGFYLTWWLLKQPAGSGWHRAHFARSAKLALESAGDFGEARSARNEFPRLYRRICMARRSGGLLLFRVLGREPRTDRRGTFRVPRERRAIFLALQPARLRLSRRHAVSEWPPATIFRSSGISVSPARGIW